MTRAVRRAPAAGDPHGTPAAAALASRPATPRASGSRDAGECWSLRLTPDERRTLGEELDALTDRERDVALAICDGGSNEAVAERLYIALPTLRTHLMRINQKLGTKSKGDVVRLMVGRLLEGYRSGRIVRSAASLNGAPGGPGAPGANGHPAAERESPSSAASGNGVHHPHAPSPARLAEPKPSATGETPERGEPAHRPGLARPKIIEVDDDSRFATARMAGSL